MDWNSRQKMMRHAALDTAQVAAREAGKYLLQKRGHVRVLTQKALHDTLLDGDVEAESIILRRLKQDFPQAGFLSEEAGSDHREAVEQWTIDPLDGSANFQHGSPYFGVTINLSIARHIVLSVIYLPVFDEMFTAVRGQGARLNGQAIYVSQVA